MTQWTQVTEEVAEALARHRPVVALETTLVSHGFADGLGLAAATESERRVREAGATPATVGIVDGAIHVGLTQAELERFAEAGLAARKVGARDLAACLAQGALGATTVGGTLAVCRQIGIRFMGTGGIGGVHRGFAESLDISGDLLQIARTQAAVVASGPKSLLDVGATSELLETLAVPVLGWQTPTLPRFYTAEGGPPVSAVVSDSPEAARICAAHWELDGAGGILLARPPADGIDLGPLIDEAVEEVRGQNLSGQAVTPAVLSIVHERSGGASVTVNRQLIEDNAALAAETAVAYAALARELGFSGILWRFDEQHRARRGRGAARADRAQQKPGQPRPAAGAEHQQVGVFRRADQRLHRVALGHQRQHRHLRRGRDRADLLDEELLGGLLEFRAVKQAGTGREGYLPGEHGGHLAAVFFRLGQCRAQRGVTVR